MPDRQNGAATDSGGNSGGSAPVLVPQPHGGGLLSGGVRGHRPPPGRPSAKIREKLEAMLTSPKAMASVRQILEDPDHRHFATMWTASWACVYGKPKETIDLNADVAATIQHEPLTILLPLLDRGPTDGQGGQTVNGGLARLGFHMPRLTGVEERPSC
jgi:hypothetical protein